MSSSQSLLATGALLVMVVVILADESMWPLCMITEPTPQFRLLLCRDINSEAGRCIEEIELTSLKVLFPST